ncbi:MAG: phosphoenolpyruvate--protein phosphotransferase [Comamonadaceae bacterium]
MTIAATALEGASGGTLTGAAVRLPNATGLHARPAAMLVALAKKYQSTIRLVRGTDEANAKSVVAIMALGTQYGDMLRVEATGADALEAIGAISALLADGCGEQHETTVLNAVAPPAPTETSHVAWPIVNALSGVCASPGLAVGRIVQYRQDLIVVAETAESPARERSKLEAALQAAQAQIEALKSGLADPAGAKILEAHQELLQDPDLLELAVAGVMQSQAAGHSWRLAFTQYAQRLESLEGSHNALLRERGTDIRDVGRRVLALIAGVKHSQIDLPQGAILIAEELTPSDTASLDRSKLLGFCTTTGGATSHVAILARSFGIPALCGVDETALTLSEGTLVVLDASQGLLHYNPSESDFARAHERMAQQAHRREQEKRQANDAAVTTDGHRIEVVANVRNATEALEAVALGSEGVGLLRSELLFDDRDTAPSEDEQAAAYVAVADALGPRRTLVIRTLDVGGDKPLPYLPLPKEDNPFLGLRGVRVSLEQPAMFRTQLRAILRTAGKARLHVMFPMIATLEELREAKAILAEEAAATGHLDVKVGIMIEVPSAALLAEQFAREADFFSIGTNDLTQYTLAMDRGHPKLAKKADGLHPSVLKMIALTCEGAARHGKWVGVCGGMASDAMAVPVLIGLGVHELSVSVPAIPAIKALVRRLSFADCQALAQEVIQLGTATEVRARLTTFAD